MENLKNAYIKHHLQQIYNKMKFMSSKGLDYDPEWEAKQDMLWHVNRFNYLHLESVSNGLTPVFITLTLPSNYHEYKQNKKGKHVHNPSYDGTTIHASYKKLTEIFRDVYNGFVLREDGKPVKQKVLYSRVVEPHKDFTPHLHAVLYVKDAKAFLNHFNNVKKRYILDQTDFEILDKANYSIAYLLKYVSKTIDGKNGVIQGWKSLNKISQVSTSRMPFNRLEYTAFTRNVKYNPLFKNIFYQMNAQGFFSTHVIKVPLSTLNSYSYNGYQKFLHDNLESFESKHKGNSKNPLFVYHRYFAICDAPVGVFVEEYDQSEFDMDISIVNEDVCCDFWDLPLCEVLEDGTIIPETTVTLYEYPNEILSDGSVSYHEIKSNTFLRNIFSFSTVL